MSNPAGTGPDTVDGPPRGSALDVVADRVILAAITVIEYAIVVSLLTVSAVVLVRTISQFLRASEPLADSVVGAIDGILVVIILLDIVHTVFRHLRNAAFPVRPFLVIGILAAVRDILSASATLTLSSHLSTSSTDTTLLELGVGVGVVVALLFGLWLLGVSGHTDADTT
jgi:uncharacterized membrane protein (DUF373 family)